MKILLFIIYFFSSTVYSKAISLKKSEWIQYSPNSLKNGKVTIFAPKLSKYKEQKVIHTVEAFQGFSNEDELLKLKCEQIEKDIKLRLIINEKDLTKKYCYIKNKKMFISINKLKIANQFEVHTFIFEKFEKMSDLVSFLGLLIYEN